MGVIFLQSGSEGPRRDRALCPRPTSALFMRLPARHHHITMNCEQDFADGGLGVTLTLRLLMHGKVGMEPSPPHK